MSKGLNNGTFLLRHGQQRYVLRVSGFLSVAGVRAEHRILLRLQQGPPPFQRPEPAASLDGRLVIGTTACGLVGIASERSEAAGAFPAAPDPR